jgi:hypothetical protein
MLVLAAIDQNPIADDVVSGAGVLMLAVLAALIAVLWVFVAARAARRRARASAEPDKPLPRRRLVIRRIRRGGAEVDQITLVKDPKPAAR